MYSVRASIHNRLPGRYKCLLRSYLSDSSPFPLALILSTAGVQVHVCVCVCVCVHVCVCVCVCVCVGVLCRKCCIGKRGDRFSICCPFKKRSVSICHGMIPALRCRKSDSGTSGPGSLEPHSLSAKSGCKQPEIGGQLFVFSTEHS